VLLEVDLEAAILYFDVNAAFGEGVVDGAFEGFVVADFENSLKGGGEVGSVVVQYGGEGAYLRDAHGGGDIGSESVVEPPAPDRFAHCEHFRSALRVGDGGQHTIGGAEVLGKYDGLFVASCGQVDEVVVAVDECGGFSVFPTVPDAFAFDSGIEVEECGWRRGRGVAEIDAVAVGFAGEAELKADGLVLGGSLDWVIALTNGASDGFRSGPQGGG